DAARDHAEAVRGAGVAAALHDLARCLDEVELRVEAGETQHVLADGLAAARDGGGPGAPGGPRDRHPRVEEAAPVGAEGVLEAALGVVERLTAELLAPAHALFLRRGEEAARHQRTHEDQREDRSREGEPLLPAVTANHVASRSFSDAQHASP